MQDPNERYLRAALAEGFGLLHGAGGRRVDGERA